ncbi:Bax inhibitor-1/YccA family protein, partial [Prevotella sp.]|uniref:Bax inhibitor-1/YccA family protein n=1 Tax=Prevotella sp. TaxID=59823 RepID=UPI002F957137
FLSARINKMSLTTATLSFLLYSVLNGVTMSIIFLAFTASSIATTFYITAGTFGAMALYGYVTKTDLSKFGSLLRMALLGLIIALVVNIFLRNSMFDMIISGIGVLIFTGLTAYDSQKIKEALAMSEDGGEATQKIALMGALTLYLDFINLFIYLLRFFGKGND